MTKTPIDLPDMIDDDDDAPIAAPNDAPATGMLPPMRLVLFIVGGLVLDWLIPLGLGHGWGWLGLFFIGGALALGKWAINTFDKAGTNVPPNKPALAVVTDGPFKYTRNPMYLSMVVLYAGLAMVADAPLMLLLLTPALWYVLDSQVIEAEEEYMDDKFGEKYNLYRDSVRRWI